MTKRLAASALLIVFLLSLLGCNPSAETSDTEIPPQIYFLAADRLPTVTDTDESVRATLSNPSAVAVTVSGSFSVFVEDGDLSLNLATGQCSRITVPAGESSEIPFPLRGVTLVSGKIHRIELTCTYATRNGEEKTCTASYFFRCTEKQATDPPRDVLSTPICDLTESERDELAQYLFTVYIPCSFGLFASVETLSSATLWSSVEALNKLTDGDVSPQSHTKDAVEKRVALFFPGSNFSPEAVRTYDAQTQTFLTSDVTVGEYEYLSYSVQGDTIAIIYRDLPDPADGQEPPTYRTVLKNAETDGYFAFVSSQRVDAEG